MASLREQYAQTDQIHGMSWQSDRDLMLRKFDARWVLQNVALLVQREENPDLFISIEQTSEGKTENFVMSLRWGFRANEKSGKNESKALFISAKDRENLWLYFANDNIPEAIADGYKTYQEKDSGKRQNKASLESLLLFAMSFERDIPYMEDYRKDEFDMAPANGPDWEKVF